MVNRRGLCVSLFLSVFLISLFQASEAYSRGRFGRIGGGRLLAARRPRPVGRRPGRQVRRRPPRVLARPAVAPGVIGIDEDGQGLPVAGPVVVSPNGGVGPNGSHSSGVIDPSTGEVSASGPVAGSRPVDFSPPRAEVLPAVSDEALRRLASLATSRIPIGGATQLPVTANRNFRRGEMCSDAGTCRDAGWGCPNTPELVQRVRQNVMPGAISVQLKPGIDPARFAATAKRFGAIGVTLNFDNPCRGSREAFTEGVLHVPPGTEVGFLDTCSTFLAPFIAFPMNTVECSVMSRERFQSLADAWERNPQRITHFQ